jgi:2-polyprenyl-3-methyl-5-hydroxy-6-metoxy-1,4-benzoquinol methylase
MKTTFEASYHKNETHHFWFRGRRDLIKKILHNTSRDSTILDIGCSSGILIQDLISEGFKPDNIYGIDISERAIDRSKALGLKHTQVMDAQNIELPQTFNVLIASDCLEHLREDTKALNNWYKLLKPKGKLIVFVPAYQFLWSNHDEVNMHYRRYTKSELKKKLETANFKIEKASYWNALLFSLIVIVRLLGKLFSSKTKNNEDGYLKLPIGNRILYNILKFENRLLLKMNFPFGVSTFCIAIKTEKQVF